MRSQAEAAQRGDYDLQILQAETDLSQKEYDLSRKDREIVTMEEKLSEKEVVSPYRGVVTEVDREGGSLALTGTIDRARTETPPEPPGLPCTR